MKQLFFLSSRYFWPLPRHFEMFVPVTEKWVNFPDAKEQHEAFFSPKSHINMQHRIYRVLKNNLKLMGFFLSSVLQYLLVYPALFSLIENKDKNFNKKNPKKTQTKNSKINKQTNPQTKPNQTKNQKQTNKPNQPNKPKQTTIKNPKQSQNTNKNQTKTKQKSSKNYQCQWGTSD